MIFLDEQMAFLHFLQGFRGPLFDPFFRFLKFFDSSLYATLLITFVWHGCSVKWGRRLAFVIIGDAFINFAAKMLFSLPRPFAFEPSLAMIKIDTSFGFPSGGSQFSFLLSCLLIYYWNSRFAWPVGLFYLLLISLSRMVLGVHFPIDVLGGWIFGFIVFIIFINCVEKVERFASAKKKAAILLTLAITSLSSSIFAYPKTFMLIGTLVVLSIGIFCSTKFPSSALRIPRTIPHRILMGTVGMTSFFIFHFLMQALPFSEQTSDLLFAIFFGLWLSFFAGFVYKRFRQDKIPDRG